MEDNFSIDEKTDRYLNGTMDGDEKESFLAEMRRNPELAKEIELQRSIIRTVRQGQVNRIMQKEEHQIRKKKRVRILSISFGTIALAASITGFFYLAHLKNCETLADRYYLSYNHTSVQSRGGESLPMNKDDSTFMMALMEMEQGNITLAIHQLESLNHPDSRMMAVTPQAVKWYLTLAFLKNGQKKKAMALLREIASEPDGEYTQKARSLLTDLR